MKTNTYIVATIKDWHIKEFANYSKKIFIDIIVFDSYDIDTNFTKYIKQ